MKETCDTCGMVKTDRPFEDLFSAILTQFVEDVKMQKSLRGLDSLAARRTRKMLHLSSDDESSIKNPEVLRIVSEGLSYFGIDPEVAFERMRK